MEKQQGLLQLTALQRTPLPSTVNGAQVLTLGLELRWDRDGKAAGTASAHCPAADPTAQSVVCTGGLKWYPHPETVHCIKGCEPFMGDNYCDAINNRAFCSYDGGDCCASTVKTKKIPSPDGTIPVASTYAEDKKTSKGFPFYEVVWRPNGLHGGITCIHLCLNGYQTQIVVGYDVGFYGGSDMGFGTEKDYINDLWFGGCFGIAVTKVFPKSGEADLGLSQQRASRTPDLPIQPDLVTEAFLQA
ncbi:UNVERIFIED_CONTAM: hypothetical protein FKN15_019009 [Acipenser sinensis]